MERGEELGGGVVVRGRVEIDMRQPFRSVKEAVLLFGEKVLAGEVYANHKLKQMEIKGKNDKIDAKFGDATADEHFEQRKKQTIDEKAKEDTNNLMVQCLNSLRQELEQTKMELLQLKSRESHIENNKELVEPEIEELKFIENSSTLTNTKLADHEIKKQSHHEEENGLEFEQKRSVKFASPPVLTRVIFSKDDAVEMGGKTPSPKKKLKKKPLVSFMGGLFAKKEEKQRK